MPTASISVTPYNGSLLGGQLLSGPRTIILNAFGGSTAGTVTDNNGILSDADDGLSTFNGQPLNYIGSGTVQPGVNVLGAVIGLGPTKPVVVFEAGGKIYFHYPSGPPNILGAVALVVRVTPAPYQVFAPVCFVEGTMIRTPDGDLAVEALVAGDLVTDHEGRAHEVLWVAGRRMDLPVGLCPDFLRWLPVKIPKDAFGAGQPDRELRVSQQHRLLIEGVDPELLFGAPQVLAPARALLGDIVSLDRDVRSVTYYHILCREHVILLANGMPAESLFPGRVARGRLGQPVPGGSPTDENSRDEAEALFHDLAGFDLPDDQESAFPILTMREAQLLRPRARVA